MTTEAYEVEGMTLSRQHWNRLKEEAKEAKMGWTEVWIGASFAFLGVGAAAAIARLAIPEEKPGASHGTQLSTEGQHILMLIAIFSVILAGVCFVGWLHKRRDHNASLDRLIKNMGSHEHKP